MGAQCARHGPGLRPCGPARHWHSKILAEMEVVEPELITEGDTAAHTYKKKEHPEERPSILLPGEPCCSRPITASSGSVSLAQEQAHSSLYLDQAEWHPGMVSDFAPVLWTGGGATVQRHLK